MVAEGNRVGGMGRAVRLRQKLTEFDNQFSTPCSPSGAADLIAPRIPPSQPRELVGLCIGSLVSGLLESALPAKLKQLRGFTKLAVLLVVGFVVVLEALKKQLWCHIGFEIGLEGPTWAQDGPSWPQDGPKRAPKSILLDFAVVTRHFSGPSWAQLGLSWALLGPSCRVQGGILRQMLGLEGQ